MSLFGGISEDFLNFLKDEIGVKCFSDATVGLTKESSTNFGITKNPLKNVMKQRVDAHIEANDNRRWRESLEEQIVTGRFKTTNCEFADENVTFCQKFLIFSP